MTLSDLEVASGLLFGLDAPVRLPQPRPGGPRAALERIVRDALERPPCVVSFSGGRDSSFVLAVAVDVARREGLPEPIPVTNLFPAAPDSAEREWQEAVVERLRLREWTRLEHGDDLDCVGRIASGVLRRHGLLWPFNAHFHVPPLRAAAGGSLLTGIGGDEALGEPAYARVRALLGRRVPPRRRDVLSLGYVAAPRRVRAAVAVRRLPAVAPWLRPEAARALRAQLAAADGVEPFRWRARFAWIHRLRYLRVGVASLAALGRDENVVVVHPLLDPRFLGALAWLPRGGRFLSRADALHSLAPDLLPRQVVERVTKARFDEAFWAAPSRQFAAAWDGNGVDHDLVDLDRLREEWASDEPDPRSFLQLQAAWLATQAA